VVREINLSQAAQFCANALEEGGEIVRASHAHRDSQLRSLIVLSMANSQPLNISVHVHFDLKAESEVSQRWDFC